MLNMNRVTLLGHAGRNPDVKELPGGVKAAGFSLATTERWKETDAGETVARERTQWHRIVAYGTAAEAVGRMVRKGAAVLIEGRVATRKYRDREGTEQAVTEIIVAGPRGIVNVLSAPGGAADSAGGDKGGSGQAPT